MADSEARRKKVSNCGDILGKLVSLISVLILAFTFIFSVYQYRSQQRDLLKHEQVDQMIKIQSQIRDDTKGISQFPKDKSQTISAAEFLLTDLDRLLQNMIAVDGSKATSVNEDRKKISGILYNLVNEDCNFDEQRDVLLSIRVLESWDDYKEQLKKDPTKIWDLLAVKYTDALHKARGMAPEYYNKLHYNKDSAELEPSPYIKPPDESKERHFEDLVRGFEKHLNLLDSDSKDRKQLIMRFQAAICNQDLTQARFGWSVNRKDYQDYPGWFDLCP